MNFQDAITTLAQGRPIDSTIEWDAQIDQALTVVVRAVLEIVGGRDDDGALGDWIANGDFDGNETAESIAAEWGE
jgi:hypothetical protein